MDKLEKRWICLIHLLDIFERILTGREDVTCIYTDTEFRRVKGLDESDEIIQLRESFSTLPRGFQEEWDRIPWQRQAPL
jgi:hypothetical protein